MRRFVSPATMPRPAAGIGDLKGYPFLPYMHPILRVAPAPSLLIFRQF